MVCRAGVEKCSSSGSQDRPSEAPLVSVDFVVHLSFNETYAVPVAFHTGLGITEPLLGISWPKLLPLEFFLIIIRVLTRWYYCLWKEIVKICEY